jgi:hemoglobin-like flavoprotein
VGRTAENGGQEGLKHRYPAVALTCRSIHIHSLSTWQEAPVLKDAEKNAITRTWRLVLPIAETAADLFYKRLFTLDPTLVELFPADMEAQKRKLMKALHFIVQGLDWPESAWADVADEKDDVVLVVLALGRRHRNLYRVEDRHYETVGQALLWTLDQGLGEAFTAEVREAWAKAYRLISTLMKLARDAGTTDIPQFQALPERYEMPSLGPETR